MLHIWRLDQPLCLQLLAGLVFAPSFAEGTDKELKFKTQLQLECQTGQSALYWFCPHSPYMQETLPSFKPPVTLV